MPDEREPIPKQGIASPSGRVWMFVRDDGTLYGVECYSLARACFDEDELEMLDEPEAFLEKHRDRVERFTL